MGCKNCKVSFQGGKLNVPIPIFVFAVDRR